MQFGASPTAPATPAPTKAPKAKREKPAKQKNDPKLIAAARELRDRWLEHVNRNDQALAGACAKYDVARRIESGSGLAPRSLPQAA